MKMLLFTPFVSHSALVLAAWRGVDVSITGHSLLDTQCAVPWSPPDTLTCPLIMELYSLALLSQSSHPSSFHLKHFWVARSFESSVTIHENIHLSSHWHNLYCKLFKTLITSLRLTTESHNADPGHVTMCQPSDVSNNVIVSTGETLIMTLISLNFPWMSVSSELLDCHGLRDDNTHPGHEVQSLSPSVSHSQDWASLSRGGRVSNDPTPGSGVNTQISIFQSLKYSYSRTRLKASWWLLFPSVETAKC